MSHVTSTPADTVPETGRESFAWLIDPLPTTEFQRDFYERRLCLVGRHDRDYYASLLGGGDLDTVLGTHALSHPEITLVNGEEAVPRDSYTTGAGRIDPLAVARRFDQGATVIFAQLHRRVPALARLCASLGQRFGSRVQTNIYLTPADAQGFKPHWDTHDVFVLQVSGRKRWSIYDTKVALPLKGQGFKVDQDLPGPVSEQFELGPGSVVYIPRGLMHSARSTTEPSLHITLGLTAFTWTDFFLESVAAAALKEESLRQNLPVGFAGADFPADEKARLYREKLDVLLARLDPAPVWRHFEGEVAVANSPLLTNLLAPRLRPVPLTLDSRVHRRPNLAVQVEDGPDTCAIRFRGQEMRLPSRVFPAVEFATGTDVFTVRDLPECLDAAGKITLAGRLVTEGVLVRGERP